MTQVGPTGLHCHQTYLRCWHYVNLAVGPIYSHVRTYNCY